jgi:hypothetical protein
MRGVDKVCKHCGDQPRLCTGNRFYPHDSELSGVRLWRKLRVHAKALMRCLAAVVGGSSLFESSFPGARSKGTSLTKAGLRFGRRQGKGVQAEKPVSTGGSGGKLAAGSFDTMRGPGGEGHSRSGIGSRHAPCDVHGPATVGASRRWDGHCDGARELTGVRIGRGVGDNRSEVGASQAKPLNDLCPGCVQRLAGKARGRFRYARSLAGSKRCQGALSRRRSRRFPRTCVPDASFLIKGPTRPQRYFVCP